jgi:MoxR-like ATPase
VNINDIKNCLPTLLKNNIVPYLHGAQGVGKTQVVRQIAKDLNMGFVALYLSNLEVGDLIGLLDRNDSGEVYHMRPNWFPTGGKGIIFLDEFNRAHPDVLQAMLPFALDKTLHTHKLPEGWHIVVAGNYNNNNFNVTDISDAALLSRFCHIDFRPSPEEFIIYAEANGAESVAKFIRHNKELLETPASSFDNSIVTPDRRSWFDMIGKLEKETAIDEQRFELYSGIIGQVAAGSFLSFKKEAQESLELSKILDSYDKVRFKVTDTVKDQKDVRMDFLNQPIDELLTKLKQEPELLSLSRVANLKKFIVDIPLELAAKLLKNLSSMSYSNRDLLVNDVEFCKIIASKMEINVIPTDIETTEAENE